MLDQHEGFSDCELLRTIQMNICAGSMTEASIYPAIITDITQIVVYFDVVMQGLKINLFIC